MGTTVRLVQAREVGLLLGSPFPSSGGPGGAATTGRRTVAFAAGGNNQNGAAAAAANVALLPRPRRSSRRRKRRESWERSGRGGRRFSKFRGPSGSPTETTTAPPGRPMLD
ncbi:unnamed protein product [Spirodela intermedia]|uniref:Uncharacterized protein n=1 Tax=Spirodela intermedia TaxID=51605 RepID=A0A7I8IU03_SPIIN|nr:unnamed protein product [Spirodela intermedia]CAA6661277.1 unnamed protein product [Spirodela intermedia]